MDRLTGHEKRYDREHNCAGKAPKDPDLASSEAKVFARSVPSSEVIGDRGDQKCCHVSAHVPAIGEQGHRMRKNARGNLDDHHHAGNGNDDVRTMFSFREVVHEAVRMPKLGTIRPMHLAER